MKDAIFGLEYVNLRWVLLLNGMALHGGVKVFGGTFFVFSDYLRPAIRLAALMRSTGYVCIYT